MLQDIGNKLVHSPFVINVLFLLSFKVNLVKVICNFTSNQCHASNSIVRKLARPVGLLNICFIVTFFTSRVFTYFRCSRLSGYVTVLNTGLLSSTSLDDL